MTPQLGLQNRPPLLCLPVIPYFLQPVVHLFALHMELLATGLTTYLEITLTALIAVMGKAKEVKGVGLAFLLISVLTFIPAETDYAGLFRM